MRPAICCALLAGCAATSGMAPMGHGTYMITRQAATGFGGIGQLKIEALHEADAFCARTGSAMRFISSTESQPPYVFGNYPRVELQFGCIPNTPTTNAPGIIVQ